VNLESFLLAVLQQQTDQHHLAAGHMEQAAARGLVLPPTVFAVRFAQGGDVGRRAAVFYEGKAVEQGVHQPEAAVAPGQVVAHQRAAVMTGAGQEGDVVLALGLNAWCNLPIGRQAPDPIPRAHGDAAGGAAQAHGLIEMRKAQPQLAQVAAHTHHPSGLVSGEQHRQLQLLQQRGQALAVLVAHLNGLELSGWWWRLQAQRGIRQKCPEMRSGFLGRGRGSRCRYV
jgi:hypothetical protein